MIKYFLVLLFTIVICSCAEIPKCNRQIPSILNYDKSKIRGVWHAIEVGNAPKSKKRCLHVTVTSENMFESGFVDGVLDEVHIPLYQLDSNSQYLAASREFPPTILSVVDTDYISYAVWFLCKNDHPQGGLNSWCVLFITTRTRQPSADIIVNAHKSLLNTGFKGDKLNMFTVDQSHC